MASQNSQPKDDPQTMLFDQFNLERNQQTHPDTTLRAQKQVHIINQLQRLGDRLACPHQKKRLKIETDCLVWSLNLGPNYCYWGKC